ncbi:sialate O-acetylesterase [Rhodanobacter sp. 115]|uniref:sialate O-acetylesterase n=1 Tax=Rhodanobacter sp. FW021-MT20 TaxID=1162282 RepID=UPI000260DB5B|nr:sialate O-acetylesterase [Rhodanobacter sp. 115]EIL91243.1 hypothetical protein UU5_14358 [Rhodanobacter sp. 115]
MVSYAWPTVSRPRCFACWLAALACLGTGAAHAAGDGAMLLNPLFQNRAVLQRGHADLVWGQAKPDAALTITFAGHTIHGRAGTDGHWQAALPALPAGGPYTLTVSTAGGATQTIRDVLVGDVWLCSGQSNMVLPVRRTLDLDSEIHDASNDRLRMLTVNDIASVTPQADIPRTDHWLPTTPANVPNFSATCYYYARELQKTEPVPMGMVVAAWGGSRIEPWMSAAALRKVGGYDQGLDLLALYAKDRAHAEQQWDRQWKAWWLAHPGATPANAPWNVSSLGESGWQRAPLERGAWQHWGIPSLANFTGMLWYRTTVTLSKAQAAQAAVLDLLANEIDQTWVNGHWVGTAYGTVQRHYQVPAGVLHAGVNLIAVNALGTYRGDGLQGPPASRALKLADGTTFPLADWQYQVVPPAWGAPPDSPWQSTSGLSTLYNGMIAPLGHYGFRGVVWYQGESNTGDPGNYRALLEGLREDFRARFGAPLPMLLVQLSSYGPSPTQPGESGWADVREAQRLVAAEDPHSGLAVSVDIGERYDIHPANKQELGRRLARVARHVIYGDKALPPSGPIPLSAQRHGDTVTLDFGDVTGKLVAYSTDHPTGFELCGAGAGSCHYAVADMRGSEVTLHAPIAADSITRVRYCWADSPICTLYDQAGLPAGPFELAVTSIHGHH